MAKSPPRRHKGGRNKIVEMRFLVSLSRRKMALMGAAVYLLAFVCASMYPIFDRRTFSGLTAVLLAWPWIDYFPSTYLLVAIVLNVIIVYVLLAILSLVPSLLRRLRTY